jgi:acyl-CoA thioester hydrolase
VFASALMVGPQPEAVTRLEAVASLFSVGGNGEETVRFRMPVIEAHLDYRRPARFDDALAIETRLGALTRVTVRFGYRGLRDEELLATGHTVLACVDAAHKPRRIPEDVVAMLLTDEK